MTKKLRVRIRPEGSGDAHEYRLMQARALLESAGYVETCQGSGKYVTQAGGKVHRRASELGVMT